MLAITLSFLIFGLPFFFLLFFQLLSLDIVIRKPPHGPRAFRQLRNLASPIRIVGGEGANFGIEQFLHKIKLTFVYSVILP